MSQPEPQVAPEACPKAPSIDLPKIIENAVVSRYRQHPKEGRLFATDLGTALGPEHAGCPRAFWGKCRDEERKPLSPGQILMFKMGELVEEYIISILKEDLPQYGWEFVGTQIRHENYGVSGRLDIKIRHIETGAIRIIDVKSKRGGAFDFLTAAKPENVLQVQFYTDNEQQQAPDVPIGGDLLYVDREGQNFVRHFEVEHQPHRPRIAARRLKILRDGPEPPPLKAKLKRVENKGDDSIYLNYPWQVEWCDLMVCPCKRAIGSLPKGIVAKVTKAGVVKMTDGNERFAQQVLDLLREQYPDEEFTLQERTAA